MTTHLFASETQKDKIARAAVELFYERGYHATGMREIANKQGVTVSNLYNFFSGKSEILVCILNGVMRDFIDGLEKQMSSVLLNLIIITTNSNA